MNSPIDYDYSDFHGFGEDCSLGMAEMSSSSSSQVSEFLIYRSLIFFVAARMTSKECVRNVGNRRCGSIKICPTIFKKWLQEVWTRSLH